MPIDNRTTNYNLAKPHVDNLLEDDVARLRSALDAVDTQMKTNADAIATKASSSALADKADLVGGKVPSGQLPSYVDDVLEVANFAALPGTGEANKIYITVDNEKEYRWSGSAYVQIGGPLVIATPTVLGSVKVGSGLVADPDGTISVVGGGGGGSGLPVYNDSSIVPSTNGQTSYTISGGYNPGQIDVFMNGVFLVGSGDDYTASNGTTVVLTVGANTTDLLVVRRWIYLPEAQAVNKTGDTLTGALNDAATVTLASATTTFISAALSNRVIITGTTAITGFGTVAAGAARTVTFAGSLVLTHNATSLILPGGANISTAAGDVAQFESLGSGNWRCVAYQPAAGFLRPSGGKLTGALNDADTVTIASASTTDIGAAASNSVVISGSTSITALGTIAAGAKRSVRFSGVLTLTHNATSLILPTAANITTAVGDCAVFESQGSGNWRCVNYMRASGSPLASATTAWQRKTATYTAASGDRIKASTTGGAWSMTAPPNPTNDDTWEIMDVDGTFNINNLTLLVNAANGNATVMGYTTSWVLNTRYLHPALTYDSTTNNWGI